MAFLTINSKGKTHICLIDKRDLKKISPYTWHLRNGYAASWHNGKSVLMHRLILGVIDRPGVEVDHRNHNKLDNRRSNLRACTRSENQRNSRKFKGSCSLKGVYLDNNRFHAQIQQGQKVKNLGRYRSEITAGKVYDKAARKLFGEFANPNFKEVPVEAVQLPFENFIPDINGLQQD